MVAAAVRWRHRSASRPRGSCRPWDGSPHHGSRWPSWPSVATSSSSSSSSVNSTSRRRIRPAMAGRAAQPADDELIPPLFADLGDLGWDLAVVGRLDLQPRVTVVAVAGSLSRAVLAVTPPGRLALHGPVVPAGVPGDLMAQVGDLPRLAALATGDVHCVCSFRRWARWQRRSCRYASGRGLLGGQGRGRLAQAGWRPCSGPDGLPVSDQAVPGSPAPEGPAVRPSRSGGSTGPSGSEGGTDRPCRRWGGTRLGGPAEGSRAGKRRLAGATRRVIPRESACLLARDDDRTRQWSFRTAY